MEATSFNAALYYVIGVIDDEIDASTAGCGQSFYVQSAEPTVEMGTGTITVENEATPGVFKPKPTIITIPGGTVTVDKQLENWERQEQEEGDDAK